MKKKKFSSRRIRTYLIGSFKASFYTNQTQIFSVLTKIDNDGEKLELLAYLALEFAPFHISNSLTFRMFFYLDRLLLRTFSPRLHGQIEYALRQNSSSASTTHFGFEEVSAADKQGRVKTVFSSVANKYDLMNDAMSLYIHRLWKDYYVSQLKIHKDSKVIDVAGGTGDIAFRVLERVRQRPKGNASVTIVDINENMLEIGKLRAQKLFDSQTIENHLGWALADAEMLPFNNNSFDVYTIAFGIRNCTRPDEVLSEAYRVLKQNGTFTCLEFGQISNPFLRRIYDAYSFQMIPVMGKILVGDFNSYKYLVESIRVFPDHERFARMIKNAGFSNVQYERLSAGICNIFTAIK